MLKAEAVFSNNMVLQREKFINLWGTSPSNGSEITVSLAGQSTTAKVTDGKWSAVLPCMPAGGPFTMNISDHENSITFENIMIGEVWLAGGQSNMELELKDSKDGRKVVENISNSRVRFYKVPRLSYRDEDYSEKEYGSTWEECSPETAGSWSAVGYYYAEKLAGELDVTIGMLNVIAEGVETEAQFEFFKNQKCDEIQGYYFYKPVPAPEIEKILYEEFEVRK